MRLIHTETKGSITVKVYYCNEWQEYQNKVYINGEYKPEQTSYTDDKQDAIDTAKLILHRLIAQATS